MKIGMFGLFEYISTIMHSRKNFLNNQLAQKQEDLQAIAQQLSINLSNVDRLRLDRNANHLLEEIEKIEKEIQEIDKREEKEKIDLENLLRILSPHEHEIFQSIQKVYQNFIPDDWPNQLPDNITKVFTELKKMPSGKSRYSVMERFIARLVIDEKMPKTISSKLQKWGEINLKEFSELLQITSSEIKSNQNQGLDPYLLVVVDRSNQDSLNHPNKEDHYFVEAWLIPNSHIYNPQNNAGCKKLHFYQEPKNETITFTQLPSLLVSFLNQIGEYSSPDLTIEIFLPFNLINQGVDSWEIQDELDELLGGCPRRLGIDYKIVIRSTERLLPSYSRRRGFWEKKWQNLQNRREDSVSSAFISWDCGEQSKLSSELGKEDIIGLVLKTPPVNTGKDSVFAEIIKTAIPVALWLRSQISSTEKFHYLGLCCIHELIKQVKNERIAAFALSEDSHIGNHLSLLWEDPNRLPPRIDYK